MCIFSYCMCVLFCRYSAHILTVVVANYLIIVKADISNVHRYMKSLHYESLHYDNILGGL